MNWIDLQARALCAASYVVKSHLKIKNMKTEYIVEIWNHIKNDEFCLIATLKNNQTFFIGIFKKREKKIF